MAKTMAQDIINQLKPYVHELDSNAAEPIIEGLAKKYGMTKEGVESFGQIIAGKTEKEALASVTKQLEDASKAWHQKGLPQATKNVAAKAFGKVKSLGKWAGIAGAVGAGALIVSTALSSKRAASEEKLANEPADLTPNFNTPTMQMAMDPLTGATPRVEGEWVDRTGRGGQSAGFAQPEQNVMPASHVQAVQNKMEDGSMAITA